MADGAPLEPGRHRARAYAAAAVAAGVLIGGGAVALVELGTGASTAARTIRLQPFGAGHTSATARLDSSERLTVETGSLPRLDPRHRYEVWLTDAGRTRMQPIGWLATSGTAQLTVPDALVQDYGFLEVSVQQVDANTYDYSGVSVLRGAI